MMHSECIYESGYQDDIAYHISESFAKFGKFNESD